MKSKITWEWISEQEPRLLLAEMAAKYYAEHPDTGRYRCPDDIWYGECVPCPGMGLLTTGLKAMMYDLVGWGRCEYRIPEMAGVVRAGEAMDRYLKVMEMFPEGPISDKEKTLRSSAAYDVAYDHLYEIVMSKGDPT